MTAVLLPTASAAATRHALVTRLKPHRIALASSAALFLVRAVAGLVLPLALGLIVNVAVDGDGAGAITAPVLAIVLATLVEGAAAVGGTAVAARAFLPALADLREEVLDRALQVPLADVERAGIGDLTARVDGDVAAVNEAIQEAFPTVLESTLAIAMTIVGLAVLDWRLALAGLGAAPIQFHTMRWYLPRSSPLYAEERVAAGRRSQQLLETVGGASTVQALDLADEHLVLVHDRSRDALRLSLAATWLRTRFFARLNLAEVTGMVLVLVVGFWLSDEHGLSAGAVTAAVLLFQRLFNPINALLYLVDEAQSAGAALARLIGVTAMDPPADEVSPADPADAAVELHDVCFGYRPGHDVLTGLDLRVADGETVALVGATGAGKSTVGRLVAGIAAPAGGTVTIGGIPVAELGDDRARLPVVLVTQEIHLYAGTLADDLRMVRPDATDDELWAALATVGATEWVQGLTDGLDTAVGDGAVELDASRIQLLALARVVLADPMVVVLDEATAEAGSAGARLLDRAAAAALAGRTGLLIAHRLSQAAAADRVVVLDAGRVVEAGTHDELAAAGGVYAGLWHAWRTS
ncbi:MAG TPA: ABC transporter ATP-binding protein [Acidimicrobiales bacterium]|nr:ABC transporter ATP-binding protein [Acidimicrobiales bacterium]